MTEIIIKLFILLVLVYISVVDIKVMLVPLKGVSLIFLAGVFMMLVGHENVNFYIQGWFVLTISSLAIAMLTGGLGGGDVKLFSALGASLGSFEALKILALSFLLSGVFVLVIRILPYNSEGIMELKNKKEIPFVPFIAVSAFLIFTENLLYCL